MSIFKTHNESSFGSIWQASRFSKAFIESCLIAFLTNKIDPVCLLSGQTRSFSPSSTLKLIFYGILEVHKLHKNSVTCVSIFSRPSAFE